MAASTQTPAQARREEKNRAAALAAGGAVVAAQGEENREPSTASRIAAAGKITAGLVAFLSEQRQRAGVWLRGQLAARGARADVPVDDIERLVEEEMRREDAFAKAQSERFSRDLTTVLAIPDTAAREAALRGLMAREELYARQRSEAMAARAFAAIDRVVLKVQSPQGALWRIDPTVLDHTAGCLFMGGKFWPWQVLDRVHPPRHPGCPCRLVGYGEAIADGLMTPGSVVDVRQAVRRAAAVVMEAQMFRAEVDDAGAFRDLLFEAYVIEQEELLVESGVVPAAVVREAHDRLALGLGERGGLGIGSDAGGFFAYGLRERTASYASPDEIPAEDLAEVGG